MFPKRCGRTPHSFRLGALSAGLIGLVAVLGGCANERGANSSPTASAPMNMAGARVVVEADGLPAQLAPRNHTPSGPDDPREPWSPNYGSVKPAKSAEPAPPTPAAEPPPARAIPARYTQPLDAEDIIRRAVATHEMRQGDR